MVKVKHRKMGALAKKKEKTSSDVVESPKVGIQEDLHENGDWVIVKKQRVTILVPPPALPIPTTHQVLRTHQVSTTPRKTIQQENSSGDHCKYLDDGRSFAIAPNVKRKVISSTTKTAPEGPKLVVGKSTIHQPSSHTAHDHHLRRDLGSSKAFRVSAVSKAIKRQIAPQVMHHHGCTTYLRPMSCLNGAALQNRMMRASNLERKLEKAGGVSRWLISLGLGRFVKLFHRKNVDKFQLLNLTMEKLKEMGAKAVGPRRKLIHAIDCLSQPYCFSTS